MRVLFTTVPLPGHYVPLLPLAWAFRTAGHDVLIAVPDNFVPVALRSGLAVASSGPATEFTDLVPEGPAAIHQDRLRQRRMHGAAFAQLARRVLPGVSSLVNTWKPDLVVSERAEFAGPIAATAARLPWTRYHWSVSALREYEQAATHEFAAEIAALGLAAFPKPSRVLDSWPASLRFPHASDHSSVRHTAYGGDARVPGWIHTRRQGKRRVCLTLGTLLPRYGQWDGPDFLADLAGQLAKHETELLIAVDNEIAAGLKALPAAVRHAGRLPLAEVFPTCHAVVHHGGHGTALTALSAGRAQLVLPHLDDQFDNAQALSEAGAALRLLPSQATAEAAAAACLELLENDDYAKAATTLAEAGARLPSPSAVVGRWTWAEPVRPYPEPTRLLL